MITSAPSGTQVTRHKLIQFGSGSVEPGDVKSFKQGVFPMAIRLYIADRVSDQKICQLLGISIDTVEVYQAYQKLDNLIEQVEDAGLKQDLSYELYKLQTSVPDLEKLANYKLFGFGGVDPGLEEFPELYCGRTDSSSRVANLLTQVGRTDLIGKVESLCWN